MLFISSRTSPAPSSHVTTLDKAATLHRTYQKVDPAQGSHCSNEPSSSVSIAGMRGCCYAPHNAAIIVAQDKKALISFSLASHQPIGRSFTPEKVLALAVSQCGMYLVGGGETGTVYVWLLTTGELLAIVAKKHQSAVVDIAVATGPLGGLFATASEDSTSRVWSLSACAQQVWYGASSGGSNDQGSLLGSRAVSNPSIATIAAHTLSVNAVTFLRNGKDWMVTGSSDRRPPWVES